MPPQSVASAAYGGDGLQAGAHRAPAGRDRVGAILHTEGVAVVPYGLRTSHVVTWESVASRNSGSARRTRPALQRDGCTAASCRARPVVSTVLTVTADSCSHVMGTGAVRMREWNRWREGADAEWWREPRCGRWWMRMR